MLLSFLASVLVATANSQAAPAIPESIPSLDDGDPSALTPEEIAEVLAQRDRYERLTVPVMIEGKGPYRFLVDTGAQASVITHHVVADLQRMPDGNAMLVAMGSSAVVPTIHLDTLEFADRIVGGLRTPLLDGRNIGADGILGLDTLQDMRVLIDFEEDRITVADAEESIGSSGYEIVVRARRKLGQMILTDARIDDLRVNVIIDSGAQRSFGNQALRRRLSAGNLGSMISTDVHGFETESELRRADHVTIGGITLTGLSLGFAESPVFAALGLEDRPALILGIGDLAAFRRIAIDFARGRVMFDLPHETAQAFLRRRDLRSVTNGGW